MACLSLRATISALSALSVAIVAAVTLAITLTTSLSALRSLGQVHATSLLVNAKVQTETLFHRPAIFAEAVRNMTRGDAWAYPSDDAAVFAMYLTLLRDHFFVCEGYCTITLVFGDSTVMTIAGYNADLYAAYTLHGAPYSIGGLPYQLTQPVVVDRFVRYWANHTSVPVSAPVYNSVGIPAVLVANTSLWNQLNHSTVPPSFAGVASTTGDTAGLAVVATANLFTASQLPLYGTSVVSLDIAGIDSFLRLIQRSANTRIFAYDDQGYLIVSTMDVPFQTHFSTNTSSKLGPGCSSSAAYGSFAGSAPITSCRLHIDTYGYAPLTSLASDTGVAFPSDTTVVTRDVGGSTYYIAVAQVRLAYGGMGVWLALVMPESDVLGDVVTGRNASIGGSCFAVALVACATFVAIAFLLRPLSTIADRMLLAATLEDDGSDDGKELSSMAEVEGLQQAYYAMNEELNRIKSFVPQTVLRKKRRASSAVPEDNEDEGSRSVTQAADNTSNPSEQSTRSKARTSNPATARVECGLSAQSVTVLAANLEGFEAAVLDGTRDAVVRGVGDTVRFVHEAAAAHKGVVQLFHGDHFVVTYNAVTPCAAHARRGVSTAQQLSSGAQAIGLKLGLRVGVATGKCLVGNLGSAEAKAFNTIGAAFTQAGLLERLTRQYGTGCRVLATRRTLTDVATHFRYRFVDIVPLPQVATLVGAVLGPALSEDEAARSGEWLYVIGSAAASTDDAINDAFCSLADGREAAFAAIMQDRLRDVDVNGAKDGILCRLLTHAPTA